MKLIEILVKKQREENWKWPESADTAEAFPHERGFVNFWINNESTTGGFTVRDWIPPEVDTVTREEYDVALAASKEMLVNKPVAWDGQGLPPVGVKCEHCPGGTTQHGWEVVTVAGIYENGVTGFTDYWLIKENGSSYTVGNPYRFRPIRTEAERKRDASVKAIYDILQQGTSNKDDANDIYRAIEAGSIPGVKLEAADED